MPSARPRARCARSYPRSAPRPAPQWLINLILFVVAPLVYRRALAVLADLSPESAEYAALGARLRADETGVYALLRSMTGQRAARPQAVGAMQRTK